jgi:hypothetical protein
VTAEVLLRFDRGLLDTFVDAELLLKEPEQVGALLPARPGLGLYVQQQGNFE